MVLTFDMCTLPRIHPLFITEMKCAYLVCGQDQTQINTLLDKLLRRKQKQTPHLATVLKNQCEQAQGLHFW